MSDRSGCALVEVAVLEALDAATGGGPRAYPRSSRVLAGIEERIGLGPRYAYEVVLDLGLLWIVPVRTVVVMGNAGDRSFSEPALGYTECRPSYAGQLVLDAEAGRLAPVPVGLINGTTYRGGSQPPLEPARVLAALRRLLAEPGLPEAEVLSIVGPPCSVTGCTVTGNIAALMRGRRVVLRETGRITVTGVPVPEPPADPPPAPAGHAVVVGSGGAGIPPPRPAHLVIETLPARTMSAEVAHAIINRAVSQRWADSQPDLARRTTLPVADIEEDSGEREVRILVTLRPGSEPEAVRDQLTQIEGVSVETSCFFPAPVAALMRSWIERYRHEDLAASLAALEDAIRRDRQRERRNR